MYVTVLLPQRATSCSPNFSVANHTVLVMGEDGEVVRAVLADSAPTGPLQVMVGGWPEMLCSLSEWWPVMCSSAANP